MHNFSRIAKLSGLFIILPSIAAAGFIHAQAAQTFSMTDPKGVSGLSFTVDSTLEPINGQTNAITGEVFFDKANPEKSSGKIVVQTKDVTCASGPLTKAMQGDWCLDPEKYATIEFLVKKISEVKTSPKGAVTAKVLGDFTLHGVTKEITVDASVTHLAEALQKRGGMPGKTGDLLVLRTAFSINRLDYNVAKDLNTELIGNKIDVKLACVGVSPK